jgi:hypothetical protein
MTSIKETLEIVRRMIQGDQIEAAIVDTNTMASLGDVVRAALAQLDSADARERIAGAARKCADDLANMLEASVRVAHRTGNSFALDRNKTASMIAGYFTGLLPNASPGNGAEKVREALVNGVHYLGAIRIRLERLYEEHPNDCALREQISDEVDWVDELKDALGGRSNV